MPVDRELIEIVTAANLAGVEAAQKSFLGLNASTLALAAVLAILVKVGQDAISNYNAQETALGLLKQATDAQGLSFTKVEADVESFIETNKRYIANQYDVIAAAGQAIRAGNDEAMTMRLLNDALDLAVIKHEDVSAAMETLILAEAGNARGLKQLGITTEEYNAIMKSKMTQEEKDAALLALIEQHTNHGRDATDKMSQSQQALNTDWQNFTARIGPGVTQVLDAIFTAADTGVQILNLMDQYIVKIGTHSQSLDNMDRSLIAIGNSLKQAADQAERLLHFLGLVGDQGTQHRQTQ